MKTIKEIHGLTAEAFHRTVLPSAEPVVLRALVRHWPLVRAGTESAEALAAYLTRFDRGAQVSAMVGPPGIEGRFGYNDDLTGFNFRRASLPLSDAMAMLMDYATEARPSALAVQSVPVRDALPGFEADNPMPLLADQVEPRVWIGNAVVVAAHHDPSENIACVVAGRRRFTLFPPDQVANLYVGPFEHTPAGPAVSLVDFDHPDLERFPRFEAALAEALVVDLEPGDALYIPYLWWHHVRSIDRINMLVNYWWTPSDMGRGRPMHALMHAMLAVRDLPPAHRQAWRAMFDHYVFDADETGASHVPPPRRGLMGLIDAPAIRALRTALAQSLSRP